MKKIISKPYLFFLGIIPIIFIFGYLNKEKSINLGYLGGVFSINFWDISLYSCIFFLLISFNYAALSWTNKHPKSILTIFHITTQILSFGVFYYYKTIQYDSVAEPNNQINILLILSFLLFVLASMLHLINFFVSVISKSK
jgi:hypothetical protein